MPAPYYDRNGITIMNSQQTLETRVRVTKAVRKAAIQRWESKWWRGWKEEKAKSRQGVRIAARSARFEHGETP